MIFFHGNAEDIGYAYYFGNDLRNYFDINVILMEYAGYGIYTQCEPSED